MSEDDLALQNAFARIKSICDDSKGRSQLFPFGGSGYKASVTHYFESSADIASFAVQPGSVDDLQRIVKAIAETRVSFGIKCGGHSTNPGFSSTRGVQIFLTRLNNITVHTEDEEKFVDVGAGCLFGEVYRELARHNLNIVGGSGLAGIGVSGWLLGGGYSVKTSQYGLGIDNIKSAGLVLPDGSFRKVSTTENEELFFAIKGGGNNFGIVTEFTLKLHPQGNYYDFQLTYQEEYYEEAKRAIANFSEYTDNKANLEAAFRCHSTPEGIQKLMTVHCVYDGVWPTESPFQELRAINHKVENYGDPLPDYGRFPPVVQANEPTLSHTTSSFYLADTLRSLENETYDLGELPQDLAGQETNKLQFNVLMSGQLLPITEFVGDGSHRSSSSNLESKKSLKISPRLMPGISQYPRGRWGNVMVDKFTPEIISVIEVQFNELAHYIQERKCRRIGMSLWPFTKDMFEKATPSAWPHRKTQPNLPIIVYLTWENKDDDPFWVDILMSTLKNLREKIYEISPSSRDLPHFINTALADTTKPIDLYGENLEFLRQLKEVYDPKGVMCLTGGFKIHHAYNDDGDCGCNQRTKNT